MAHAEPVSSAEVFYGSAGQGAYRAHQILHFGFTVLPIVAGLDKFFHILVNWDQYLWPGVTSLLPVSPHGFMQIVGVVEVAAGILVGLSPRRGSLLVAAWLGGILINLLLIPGYFDIALRDFGLMLGALSLASLSRGPRVGPAGGKVHVAWTEMHTQKAG